MNIVLFTRSFYILLTKIIIAIPLFIIAIMFMIRYKESRIKCTVVIIGFLVIGCLVPYEKMVYSIPFKLDTVEDAMKFDYDNQYKIIYRKKYRNTYFIVAQKKTIHFFFLRVIRRPSMDGKI